jgi:hypothetical protein
LTARRAALAALAYSVLFGILTWPAPLAFSSHYFGDSWDGLQNAWNLWWFQKALGRGVLPWYTDQLFHPTGVTLIGHTLSPVNAALATLFGLALNPVEAYNAVIVFAFVASGTTTFLLASSLGARPLAAAYAGAAFGFGSYAFAHAQGHMNLLSLEWLPLFLLAWKRWLDAPSARGHALVAALAFGLVFHTEYYYALYGAMAGAAWLLLRVAGSPGEAPLASRLGGLGLFVGVAAALCGPVVARLALQQASDPLSEGHVAADFSLDLFALFVPGGHAWLGRFTEAYWSALTAHPVETSVYVGWSVWLPALWTLGRAARPLARDARVLWILTATFAMLALGPQLQAAGEVFEWPLLPYGWIEALTPALRLSGVPVRMAAMVALGAALLAALGLPGFWAALRHGWARALFLAAFLVELWPAPLSLTAAVVPDYVAVLRDLPPGAVHLVEGDGAQALVDQTGFEKPMSLGLVSRLPLSYGGRRDAIEALLDEGAAAEVLRRFQLRYVVLDNADERGLRGGLRRIFQGAGRSIHVAADDLVGDPPGDGR